MLAQRARAILTPDRRLQVIDVGVRGSFRPDLIAARAGIPLRIRFHRDDDDVCSERVIFSAPRLDRRLASGAVTVVDLPAQARGEIRFTCGMGRYRGRIKLDDGERGSLLGRLRQAVVRRDDALGTALVLWLCSLPLVAIVGLLLFDGLVALALAGLALAVWLVTCSMALAGAPSGE